MPTLDGFEFDRSVVPLEDARAITRVSLRKGDLRRAQNILRHASRIRSHPSFHPPATKPSGHSTKLEAKPPPAPAAPRRKGRRPRPRPPAPLLDAEEVVELEILVQGLRRVRGPEDDLHHLARCALEKDDPAAADRLYLLLEALPEEEQEPLIAADRALWEERQQAEAEVG